MFGPIPTFDPFTPPLPGTTLPITTPSIANNNNNNNMDTMPGTIDGEQPNFDNMNRAAL